MIKYRYFPFLGVKTLDDDEKKLFDLPDNLECKGLVFEWLYLFLILFGKVYEKKDVNGN